MREHPLHRVAARLRPIPQDGPGPDFGDRLEAEAELFPRDVSVIETSAAVPLEEEREDVGIEDDRLHQRRLLRTFARNSSSESSWGQSPARSAALLAGRTCWRSAS